MNRLALAAAAAITLAAGQASAHTGAGAVHGFSAGMTHPLFGADHLLAMVAVGLWAGLIGGAARLAFPAAFVSAMALGGLMGMSAMSLPGVEIAIALSVVVLGLAIALKLSPGVAIGAATCAVFALFHGFAHGAELPAGAGALGYAAGFLLATAALHAIGLGIAGITAARAPLVPRLAGVGLALAGGAILLA